MKPDTVTVALRGDAAIAAARYLGIVPHHLEQDGRTYPQGRVWKASPEYVRHARAALAAFRVRFGKGWAARRDGDALVVDVARPGGRTDTLRVLRGMGGEVVQA